MLNIQYITGIKCYYDGEDVTHLIKIPPSGDGEKLAGELSQILPLVAKDNQETIDPGMKTILWFQSICLFGVFMR